MKRLFFIIILSFFLATPNFVHAQLNRYLQAITGGHAILLGNPTDATAAYNLFDSLGVALDSTISSLQYYGLNVGNYASLSAAITTAKTDTATLIIANRQTISSNVTADGQMALVILRGGIINGSGLSDTLSIKCSFDAGGYQVFGDSLTVKFANNSVSQILPEWFGAVGDSTGGNASPTDDSTAIQRAYDTLELSGGGTLYLSKRYHTTGTLAGITTGSTIKSDSIGVVMASSGWIRDFWWPKSNIDDMAGDGNPHFRAITPMRYVRKGGQNLLQESILEVGGIQVHGEARSIFGDITIEPIDSINSQKLYDPVADTVITNPTAAQRVQAQYRRSGSVGELKFHGNRDGGYRSISWLRKWDYGDTVVIRNNDRPILSDTRTWEMGTGTPVYGGASTDDFWLGWGYHSLELMKFRLHANPDNMGTDTTAISDTNAVWHPWNMLGTFYGPMQFTGGIYDADSTQVFFDIDFSGRLFNNYTDSTYVFRIKNNDTNREMFYVKPDGLTYADSLITGQITFRTSADTVIVDSLKVNNNQLGIYDSELRAFYALAESEVEMLTNGDMELNANWSAMNTATTSQSSTQKHAGTYSWEIISAAANDGVTNTTMAATTTGNIYRVSYWAYVTDTTGSRETLRLFVRKGDGTPWAVNGEDLNGTLNAWKRFETIYTESAGGTGAYIIIENLGITTTYIDDVKIEELGRVDGSVTLPGTTVSTGSIAQYNSLKKHRQSGALADDAQITIATGVAGWGFAMIGDMQEYSTFYFTSAGVVTLGADATANVVNTDTDTKFCIYDAGSGIAIKNRLGSSLAVAINVNYYSP